LLSHIFWPEEVDILLHQFSNVSNPGELRILLSNNLLGGKRWHFYPRIVTPLPIFSLALINRKFVGWSRHPLESGKA